MRDSWEGSRVRVVEQAAHVLYAFAASRAEKGVRELARDLTLSTSTVERIVTSLERVNLLSFNPSTRKYSLGPGVLRLAGAFSQQNDLIGAARPRMEELWRATLETVCLHVRADDRRITICQLESPHELRFTAEIGRPFPLHAGAAGRCLLAFLPPSELDRILAEMELEPLTANTITDRSALRGELARCRELGYVHSRGERVSGGVGLAAPILVSGAPIGSISIYAPEQRLDQAHAQLLVHQLVEAAQRIALQCTGVARTPISSPIP